MTEQKITFQEAMSIVTKQCRDAQVAMAKAFRAIALSTAKRRDEEVTRKCQEPRLVEKREQAKKDFNEFERWHGCC